MATSATRLLLVRHGQTPWNVAGRWQGHANPGLTAQGARQAQAGAQAIATTSSGGWSSVLSSDLERALRTARTIARVLELPIETDRRLRERDVGRWSGLTRPEIARVDPETLAAFDRGRADVRPGGGESRLDVAARALAWLREIVERRAGERLIVVTHLGVIRALVPGASPSNAEWIEAVAEEIVERGADARGRADSGAL